MVQLKNKTRSPVTVELTSLGTVEQTDVRVGRDKTGAFGAMEVKQTFPKSVTIAARAVSEELPDAVAADPALADWRGVLEVVAPKPAAEPPDSTTASPDAPKEK